MLHKRMFIISLGPHIKHIPWFCGRSYLPHSKGHIIMVARFTLYFRAEPIRSQFFFVRLFLTMQNSISCLNGTKA